MKIIVAGGRNFNDYNLLKEKLDFLTSKLKKEKIVIVSGGASGADSLGERYAKERGFSLESFPAEWNKYGRSAGYRRNVQMALNSDALVAFWDGKSKGTEHMINIATERDLKVRVVRY